MSYNSGRLYITMVKRNSHTRLPTGKSKGRLTDVSVRALGSTSNWNPTTQRTLIGPRQVCLHLPKDVRLGKDHGQQEISITRSDLKRE